MRKKNAIKSIISSLFLQIITILCGFIVPKLIISNYGSAVNGLISSITQFLAYIMLLQSGFGPVVKSVLYKPLAKKDNRELASILKVTEKFFKTIGYTFIIYLIILCLFYPYFVSNEFDYLFTISLIIIISISTFVEYFIGLTYQIFLQADQKSYINSYLQIITTIINTVLVVILILLKCNIQIVKLASSIIFIIRPLILKSYFNKKYDIDIKSGDDNYKIKQKWEGLAQHVASVIHGNTDVTVITIFCGVLEVSVYSVYMLVIKGIRQLVLSFINGIDASFGDMHAKNELQTLNRNFKKYEIFYHSISTIIFTCTILLIIPFIRVYTSGVDDVNYIRPLFGLLIVISEFIWAIRQPYHALTLAVGHFKETRTGAWIESIVNITVSVALVFKFGIVGVAIGTIVAMFIRTVEYMYHTSRYILNRKMYDAFKWLLIIASETTISIYVVNSFISENVMNYFDWVKYAVIVALISSIIVCFINFIFNYKTLLKCKVGK